MYVHFALHLWLPHTPTPPLAIQPDGIINTTFFDVRRAVGNTVNTRGDLRHDSRADDLLVYSPYNGDVHSPGKRPLEILREPYDNLIYE